MNNLENMTIEEAHSLLVMRSDIVEQLIKLDKIVEGEVFVMGTDRERRIFLTEKAFMKFAKLFGKETDNILMLMIAKNYIFSTRFMRKNM